MIDRKRQRLERHTKSLREELEALDSQLEGTVDEGNRVRISRRIESLESELAKAYDELQELGGEIPKRTEHTSPVQSHSVNAQPQKSLPARLSGEQRRQFQDALINAFPNENDLRTMVRDRLEQNLAAIAGGGRLKDTVFNLIEWAESQGMTTELLQGARRELPKNPYLKAFAQQFNLEDVVIEEPSGVVTPQPAQSGETQSPESKATTQPVQPDTKAVELHIDFSPHDSNSYHVDLTLNQKNHASPLTSSTQIAFDIDDLRELQLDPKALGTKLGKQLFDNGAIASRFAQARGAAGTDAMRLRLTFDTRVAALHDLPWETLWYEFDDIFLAKNGRIFFSRYVEIAQGIPVQRQQQSDLRALIAIANPSNLSDYTPNGQSLAPIDVVQELFHAQSGFGTIPTTSLASGGKATVDNMMKQVNKGVSILYLAAHGALIRDTAKLWLEKDDGTADVVTGDTIVERINGLTQPPSLIVLASCQSAGGDDKSWRMDHTAWKGASALAIKLAQAGIPAVLAMQGNITMETISRFMPHFLEELQKHGEIDRAVSVARSFISDRHDWWMPVLFMSMRDGRLWSE